MLARSLFIPSSPCAIIRQSRSTYQCQSTVSAGSFKLRSEPTRTCCCQQLLRSSCARSHRMSSPFQTWASSHASNNTSDQPESGGEDEILTKEEDWVVPGGYQDSMSSNTELGRAVKAACEELETLGVMERENFDKAEELLAKLGYTAKPQQDDQPTNS